MKSHLTPQDDFIGGFSTVNIQNVYIYIYIYIYISRGVKCNFTKQPVDQHRLTNLYNIYILQWRPVLSQLGHHPVG